MAEFKITSGTVRRSAESMGSCSSRLSGYGRRIGSVRSSLMYSSLRSVAPSLRILEAQAEEYQKSMQSMQVALNRCVSQYETSEKLAAGKSVPAWQIWMQDQLDQKSPGWELFKNNVFKDWKREDWEAALKRYEYDNGAKGKLLSAAASFGVSLSGASGKHKEEVERGEGKIGKKLKDDQSLKDPKTGKTLIDPKTGKPLNPKDVKYGKKNLTLAEIKAEGNVEGSIYEWSIGNENASAEIKLGHAEAHGSLKTGLYGYDKYGNRLIAPGVEATVGASVLVASVSGKAGIGDEYNGAGVDGEITLGKASAEGTAKFAIFGKDEKGNLKFNPEGKLSGSAELIGAEAKASGNVRLLGTEAKVSGSVNVGIGAHAEVGYVDGKIKCDIGAAVGVGFSVSFEVDVSKTVDAVTGFVKALWPFK